MRGSFNCDVDDEAVSLREERISRHLPKQEIVRVWTTNTLCRVNQYTHSRAIFRRVEALIGASSEASLSILRSRCDPFTGLYTAPTTSMTSRRVESRVMVRHRHANRKEFSTSTVQREITSIRRVELGHTTCRACNDNPQKAFASMPGEAGRSGM